MPAYSMEEKLKKDKLYHAPLREEHEAKNKTDKGQGLLRKLSDEQTIKLTNYYSSFSAGIINDWEGDKKTATICAERDFRHRTLSHDEKNVNMKRKSQLFPGARRAFANNVNKHSSAVYLKEIDLKTTSNLIRSYKKLVEKSNNLALQKSLSFLDKEPEKEELFRIDLKAPNAHQRVNYLRDVMSLKDQRSLEFKNKLLKTENMRPPTDKKRGFDILGHLAYISLAAPEEVKKKDGSEDIDPSNDDVESS